MGGVCWVNLTLNGRFIQLSSFEGIGEVAPEKALKLVR
jgi:hypothetical protein